MISDRVLIVDQVSFAYPYAKKSIIQKMSLAIASNEIVALFGPSGCGKSTLIRLIAGFLAPNCGHIYVGNSIVSKPDLDRLVVFQNNNLFPWKTVKQNIAFGLRMTGYNDQFIEKEVAIVLSKIGLNGSGHLYPSQLSGGMAQRVALARALINRPKVLLLDEPFGSLDYINRLKMQSLFLDIWKEFKTTTVIVSHDIDEALLIADRILIFSTDPQQHLVEICIEAPRPDRRDFFQDATYVTYKRLILSLL